MMNLTTGTPTGCSLDFHARPHCCRAVVAGKTRCAPPNSKEEYVVAWVPYQTIIDQAAEASGRDCEPMTYDPPISAFARLFGGLG